ncbi:MAG: LytTR family DNA-binding domain-containing protein [Bacteroidota bacterium]
MKVLVIDNEDNIRNGLVNQLKKLSQFVSEVHEAVGVESGLLAINTIHPDVVFLDVEMDDGTGFDLIKRLDKVNFQLIFITAFDKYAVTAFKLSAIDFLLKPIDSDELVVALEKVSEALQSKNISQQLDVLKSSLLEMKSADQKIVLQDNKSIYFVKIADIFNCEAEGSYTTFHLMDGSKILVSKSLKEYEALLETHGFIRTHHSHLVNIKKILRFTKADGGSLILENNQEIPVSQRKKEQVLELLSKL